MSGARRAPAAAAVLRLVGGRLQRGAGIAARGSARSVRPAAVAAAVLVLAALAPGCGGGSRPHPGEAPARGERPHPLRALLDARAAALERGDARAHGATAIGAQRRRDVRHARRARALRLRDVAIRVRGARLNGRRARIAVLVSYRVAGARGRFELPRVLAARRTGGGWRIASERAGRQRHPWEIGRLTRRDTRHFAVVHPRGLDVAAGGLLPALERGLALLRFRSRLAAGRARRLVLVAADPAQARRLTAGIEGVETLAAISDTRVRERGPARRVAAVVAERLIVVWSKFRALPPELRRRIVAHELTHLALAGETSGRTPAWLVEGLALWASGDRRVAEAAQLVGESALPGTGPRPAVAARRNLTLTALSPPAAIARLAGAGQRAAYAYSSAAAHYIAARYGRRRLLALQRAFNDPRLRGPGGAALTDRAVRRVLGRPLLALERDLRRWIVTRAVVVPGAP